MLVGGWWLRNGYFGLEEPQNNLLWNDPVSWALLFLALPAVWPAQRWLRPRLTHIAEDSSDNPYSVISRVVARMDTELTAETLPVAVVRSLAETLNLPYVGLETEDNLAAETGPRPATSLFTLPLRYNNRSLGALHLAPRRSYASSCNCRSSAWSCLRLSKWPSIASPRRR